MLKTSCFFYEGNNRTHPYPHSKLSYFPSIHFPFRWRGGGVPGGEYEDDVAACGRSSNCIRIWPHLVIFLHPSTNLMHQGGGGSRGQLMAGETLAPRRRGEIPRVVSVCVCARGAAERLDEAGCRLGTDRIVTEDDDPDLEPPLSNSCLTFLLD